MLTPSNSPISSRSSTPLKQAADLAERSISATARAGLALIGRTTGLILERSGEAISDGGKMVAKFGAASTIYFVVASKASEYFITPESTPTISALLPYSGLFTGGKPFTINDPDQPMDPRTMTMLTSAVAAGGVILSVAGTGVQEAGKRITELSKGASITDKKVVKVASDVISLTATPSSRETATLPKKSRTPTSPYDSQFELDDI